jgi:hypothetical protein
MLADRAGAERHPGERLVDVPVIPTGVGGHREAGRQHAQQLPAEGELLRAVAVAKKAVVTDAVEPGREDMEQEAAEELGRVQRQGLLPIVMPIILPPEADLPLVDGEQAVVRDRDPVGVPAEVLKDLRGPPERGLCVDHPLGLAQERQRSREGGWGKKGYCLMPYAYLTDPDLAADF